MVYGKILFNNIKEYTPKWYPTIPYSQTIKPVFGRKPQVSWKFNTSPAGLAFWKNFNVVFQRQSWMWQILIVAIAFTSFHVCVDPWLYFYKVNNKHRTYAAAMVKEKAHKKKLKEQEQKQEAEAEGK